MAKFPSSHSWIFHGFPELDPDAILREAPDNKVLATEEERQRAWWLWQRRPREMRVLAYGILLGAGAVVHTPLLLLGPLQLFCLFHACYVLFVLGVIGMFITSEAAPQTGEGIRQFDRAGCGTAGFSRLAYGGT
ncbi:MAG: hypothetical protein JO232_07675, partial [Verrucomicrobia bacterium]|nr:hypothetical protein [Verrucomicrobiota bacterium]